MYEKRKENLYFAGRIKLPLYNYAFDLTYLELLDETYADFTQVHDCLQIYFCLENSLAVSVGGREYLLSPGDFLLIMPGTPHNVFYDPTQKKTYLDVMFEWSQIEKDNERSRPLVAKIAKLASIDFAAKGSSPVERIKDILDKMETETRERSTGWHFLFRGYCLEFLILCLREIVEPVAMFPRDMDSINVAIGITKYMHRNYNKKITLKDVADVVHISPRHAHRIFKDFFGLSFSKALNLYRLSHAKSFLINTDLTIDEVAEKVGLSSSQPLYKLFREKENMSVNEYRVLQKERLLDISFKD